MEIEDCGYCGGFGTLERRTDKASVKCVCCNGTGRITDQADDGPQILKAVYEEFGIGRHTQNKQTVLENVRNAVRRSWCLTKIESFLSRTITIEEDGEEFEEEESLLNWGESPEEYIKTFKAVWNARPNREVADEELKSLLRIGWELSTWSGSINWRGEENQKEWLDELRVLVEGFQDRCRTYMATRPESDWRRG